MLIPIEIVDQDAQYIMAAFSEGYMPQIENDQGELIANPITQQDFALANVLTLLKDKVSDYLQRQAVGEAKQAVEEVRIAAAATAARINFSIAEQP